MRATSWQKSAGESGYFNYLQAQKVTDADLVGILEDASKNVNNQVESVLSQKGSGIGKKVRIQQYQMHQAAINERINELWDSMGKKILQGTELSTAAGSEAQQLFAQFLATAAEVEGISTAQLEHSFVTAARRSAENVRSRVMNNIDFSSNVYKNKALSAKWVQREVNRGIAQGQSAKEIANRVRDLIRPDTPGGVSFAAKRLGRTELNNAFHTTSVRAAGRLPFTTGIQWFLSASHPRPDQCDTLAERDDYDLGAGVYQIGSVPFKPHPQCLCFTTTITVDQKQFENNLLAGHYDDWLISHGQAPIGGMIV